ncbi:MAG: glycosyltransferase, partial [Candidatus Desantisbacteria bacterium]
MPSDISIRREFNISGGALLLGIIGRLVAEKGHFFCLDAFKKVLDSLPGAILLIVGDGPMRNDIEAKIREMHLEGSVIMAGHRNDVAKILASLDISLLTSFCEGTPVVIMEAMFIGKPIIATTVGGIPEMIVDDESGILVPPGNVKALADAIVVLACDKELAKRLGETACKRAEKRFTLELMIENITKLYNSFIESKLVEPTQAEKMIYASCNICGSNRYQEICDIQISPFLAQSKLVKCSVCSFFYANPRLDKKEEEEYYIKYYHEIEEESSPGYWCERRIGTFKKSLSIINKFIKNGRLIDLGCGKGYFMELAKNQGWEARGVEISDTAVDHARRDLG